MGAYPVASLRYVRDKAQTRYSAGSRRSAALARPSLINRKLQKHGCVAQLARAGPS